MSQLVAHTWKELHQKLDSKHIKYAGHVLYEGKYYPSFIKRESESFDEYVLFIPNKSEGL